MNSAFESFQKQIEIGLSGCKGVKNISDDEIWGRSFDKHNEHLHKALTWIEEHGLKKLKEMYIWHNKFNFLRSQVMSLWNKALIQKKVVDICNLVQQHQQQKLKSLCDMLNYCSHFIQASAYEKQGHATIACLITKFRGYRSVKSCTPPTKLVCGGVQ